MTAQPAPSRIDTYDFAFRTTPDSHLYWQSTLCSIFTDRLIPCLGFKILVKRSTIPMPFLATSSRSWLSRNDNRFEMLDSVPIRSRHQKASPPKPTAISKKLYPREGCSRARVEKIPEKIRRRRIGALLLAKLSNPRDTRIGLSHVSPPCSSCKFTFYRRYYKTDWHLLDHVITP